MKGISYAIGGTAEKREIARTGKRKTSYANIK